MELIVSILEQAFLFSLVSIGVYITYKILDFPDLSVDGTFPLGAAVASALIVSGVNHLVSTFIAMAIGGIAGGITAILHVKLKITNLMSGILVMIGLYSVNLFIMGKSNLPLFSDNNIFNNNIKSIFIISIILIIVKLIFDYFMKTQIGFLLIGVGDNEQVVTSLGVSKNKIKFLGLVISNALVALSGALSAQYNGFSDVNMGSGIVVKGLACVIIGVSLFKKLSFINLSTLAILGTVIYYGAIQFSLELGLNPNNLKLLTALLIVFALSLNNFKIKSLFGGKSNA
ncbi:ABC transporter permease [Clostridium sp. LY3-2]|uniref:ABC transporter permease n=1 Tax=Clostridium sp. LY3-2 TaxID=2942482 RepID=UPI0021522AD6|nr:ABC transporter permease [Clostridium sp. LY3-2]MCR6515461.1 ABC transporter permease [Clostridium sp. LY3-2]